MRNKILNKIIITIISLIGLSCLLIMPDLKPPEVEILSPVHGEVIYENVEIKCVIEDNSNLSRAQLWVNNDSVSSSGISNFFELQESYSMYWNTSHIDDGTYYLQVWAYDENGNVGKSDEITIYVDNSNSMPGASPIISVDLNGQDYQLTWQKTDATDFKKYKLQHLHPWVNNFNFNKIDLFESTNPNDTTFEHININATLINNYYRVVVYDTLGFDTPSSPKFVLPDPFPNEIEISSTEYDNNSIIINWDQSIEFDFLRYELFESYDEDMDESILIYSNEDPAITSFVRYGIYDNETRYYRIDVVDIWEQQTESPIKMANAFTRFYKTIGGINDDVGYHVLPIENHGFIISGSSESFGAGNEDGIVVKLDSEGKKTGQFTFGYNERDIFVNSIMLEDSSLIFIGRTESIGQGGSDGWVVHSDMSGNLLSEFSYGSSGNDRFTSIVKNDNGTLAAIGIKALEDGSNDFWLVEMDPSGNMISEYTYGGADYEFGRDIYPSPIGGYLLLGETRSYGAGGFDIWLVQVNSIGEQQWQTTLSGTSNDDYARKLIFDRSSGGYYILTKEGGSSSSPVCIIKIDVSGNEIWRHNYGYTASDDGVDMIDLGVNSDYLLVLGTTYKNGNGDLWLYKVDVSSGEYFDENIFDDGDMDDHGHSINIVAEDGGYILVGESSSYGAGGKDIVIIKTDPYGNTVGYEGE